MTPSYGGDLARIHHAAFGDLAEQAAPRILSWLGAAGIRDGLVVDLGCGSGLWAAAFDAVLRAGTRPMAYRTWRADADWAVLVEVGEEARRTRLVREITTFRRLGADFRRAHETHVQRLHTRPDLDRALRDAGFSVRVHRGYGAYRLGRRRLAFRAQAPREP